MKARFFYHSEHARQYLCNSKVLYKGQVCDIVDARKRNGVVSVITNGDGNWVDIEDDDLMLQPPGACFLQIPSNLGGWQKDGVTLAQRTTRRQWRVPINADTVTGCCAGMFSDYRCVGSQLVRLPSFKNFFLQSYPSFEDAKGLLISRAHQVAVGPHFFLEETGDIHEAFHEERVGTFNDHPSFFEHTAYLQEKWEEQVR